MDFLTTLIDILIKWYIWLPIALVLGYLAVRNNRRAKTVSETEHVLLILEIPRTNDKKELAAEQMFASLHGILRNKQELAMQGGLQEHISFEIAAIEKRIRFYVWLPKYLQNFVEGQIYAQYPTVQIHIADEDYSSRSLSNTVAYTAELGLIDNDVLPIKTFQSFEVDPLAAITATLAKLEDNDEEMWIQFLIRPVPDDWHRKSSKYVSRVKSGAISSSRAGAGRYALNTLEALWKPPADKDKAPEVSERDKGRISEIEKKSVKLGYRVKIRIAYLGHDQQTARLRMQGIVGSFKQFNSTNLNGFQIKNPTLSTEGISQYRARFFIDKGYILNIEELASVFHLPHTNVETPNIVWASSKTAEPPAKLPIITGTDLDGQISAFGLTNFRGLTQQFGMLRGDRGRHVYIIGQTGTGKSGLLELFALSDIYHKQGYAIIDPHGDFAINNLRFIPPSRIKDVIYFNPADTSYPVGFNPMEVIDVGMKNNISSEVIGVLKRMFGESWGPRLEYILRYAILALLDTPNTTLLDITRILTDKKFRKMVVDTCQDKVVKQFWNIEFASWTDKFASEAIAPVLNKVGAFTANPIIRNIIGQPRSTFNIRQIMDDGKILVVNLSKGLIGEDNAAILGSFLVTKIQLAAMSRSDIPRIEDRRPFYLYVDEFQNFATDSFATILSEARKYGLNLVVANQYVSQMQPTVRDAVFGNVGSMISFRISPDDAPLLGKQFAPQFLPEDIMQMHNRHFITSMVINGEKAPAFSATTLTLPPAQTDFSPQIIDNTRQHYARTRADVEEEIAGNVGITNHQPLQNASPAPVAPKSNTAHQQPTVTNVDKSSIKVEPSAQTPTTNTLVKIAESTAQKSSAPAQNLAPSSANNSQPANTPTPVINSQQAAVQNNDEQPKKRKRRRRKNKSPNAISNNVSAQQATGQNGSLPNLSQQPQSAPQATQIPPTPPNINAPANKPQLNNRPASPETEIRLR